MKKTIADSAAVQVHMVTHANTNSYGTLFGGCLMNWIDEVAGVVAHRHSENHVCTASVNRLDFLHPSYVGDVISVEGRLVHTGRTSMIIQVNTYMEHKSYGRGEKQIVNQAYLTMVALDDNGKPTPVPALEAGNEEERELIHSTEGIIEQLTRR